MRCKNCGSENDDNLYICQNCGSPLYDEEDNNTDEIEKTQVFSAQADADAQNLNNNKENKDKKKKQTTAIIIVLCVVLVAIIAGTIIAVAHSKNREEETSSLTQVSTTVSTTKEAASTTTTTETTTETTTTTTTKETTFNVNLSCNDGGEVEGEGTYKRGENVNIIARPDDGYDFDGWYEGNKKVSSKESYTFTVTKNTSLQAVFTIVNDESDIDVIAEDQD